MDWCHYCKIEHGAEAACPVDLMKRLYLYLRTCPTCNRIWETNEAAGACCGPPPDESPSRRRLGTG